VDKAFGPLQSGWSEVDLPSQQFILQATICDHNASRPKDYERLALSQA
jgi:hypothetical protein